MDIRAHFGTGSIVDDMEGILVIDKPSGPTSHDIVDILRRKSGIKRIGHTGTLDPMATGVMVVLIGRATRVSRFLELEPKTYIAEATFGITTDTQDITGEVLSESAGMPDEATIKRLLPDFAGDILQVPPMVSAVKIGGKKLYKLARAGHEVERPARGVHIFRFEFLESFEAEGRLKAVFEVECSGGTYVRTLIHDLGERAGGGAALSALRRTRVGRFGLEHALTIDALGDDSNSITEHLLSVDNALDHLAEATIKTDAVAFVKNGRLLDEDVLITYPKDADPQSYLRIKTTDGEFLGLGRVRLSEGFSVAPEVVLAQ